MQLTESLTMAISKPCLYEKCIVKCFVSEISKGGCLLYKKKRLIGIFNWIEEYTLFSERIWFLTSSCRLVPFQKVVKIFFQHSKDVFLRPFLPAEK